MTICPSSSPCIGICRMENGLCAGCLRTLEEIAQWTRLSEAQRLRVMREVLPQRQARLRSKQEVGEPTIQNDGGDV